MHIAIYCRVSTDEQAKHGESIADQEQALVRWARENGHTYDVYPDEGYSAHKSYKSRPKLMELLSRIDNYQLIIFTKFDRWTRKAADYYKIQDILDKHGVAWKAILEDYETVTSDGRFKVGIMLSVNQHEAERTSDRIKFTFAEKRKRGEIVSGNMPRGYSLVDGKPVKNEDAKAVQAFWDAYILHGMSAAQRAAGEHGLNIGGSSSSFMLRNAMHYTGHIQGVECEPYISVEQAERIISGRKSRPKAAKKFYIFSGLLVCGECGSRMSGHVSHYAHADGTQGEQAFYNCNARHKAKPYQCANKTCMLEGAIEKYLFAELGTLIADYNASISKTTGKKEKSARDRLQNLEAKKKRAYEVYIDGLVDRETFEKQMQKIEADIKAVKMPEKEKTPIVLPADWQEAYKGATPENRRLFWQSVIKEIRINPDRSITVIPL